VGGGKFVPHSLDLALLIYGAKLCTDPRDKIYALLSISDYDSDIITPNYNLSVLEVY
jgi:hypothetical protein